MNKKMKGFTLIELLAVIVILAIIALIAVPLVMDVISDAKYSAAKSEAKLVVDAINNYCATAEMKNSLDGTAVPADCGTTGSLSYSEANNTMVDMGNATIPTVTVSTCAITSGQENAGSLTMANGRVTAGYILSNGHTINVATFEDCVPA